MPDHSCENVVELKGKRILLIEDELLLAWLTESLLEDLGCEVIGPVATVAAGCTYVANVEIDAAVLDIDLRRELVFPVIEDLKQRGIPFLFASSYPTSSIPPKYRQHARIYKPIDQQDLAGGLRKVMS